MYFMSVNKFKDDADWAQINSVLSSHREWVKKQIAAGVIVQAGKWGDRGGMIIIRAGSMSEAEKIADQDPLAQARLINFETAVLHAAVPFK
jgi:uncharacterized protein YciI